MHKLDNLDSDYTLERRIEDVKSIQRIIDQKEEDFKVQTHDYAVRITYLEWLQRNQHILLEQHGYALVGLESLDFLAGMSISLEKTPILKQLQVVMAEGNIYFHRKMQRLKEAAEIGVERKRQHLEGQPIREPLAPRTQEDMQEEELECSIVQNRIAALTKEYEEVDGAKTISETLQYALRIKDALQDAALYAIGTPAPPVDLPFRPKPQ